MKNIQNIGANTQKMTTGRLGLDQTSGGTFEARSNIEKRQLIRKNLLPEVKRYLSRSGREAALTSRSAREL